MQEIRIFEDPSRLSAAAAEEILALVRNKPDCVLCLATGDTPRLAYKMMVERALSERIDMSGCTFVALDEWVGIAPDIEGSCHHFLQSIIFEPLAIRKENIYLFDAMTTDLTAACRNMDAMIVSKGGIDLMLVGVGMNGHIGFNEPGVGEGLYAHVIALDETTRSVGKKYFNAPVALEKGITLGLQHLAESRKVIMMASGAKKAPVIKSALEGPVSAAMPASLVRKHQNSLVMLDVDSASMLQHR